MESEQTQVDEVVRTRATSWGGSADRRVLQRIAEDVAARAGFAVCAIEVLRHDDMLEFVAIHGSPDGAARLLGQGSPLSVMTNALACGADCDPFTFVAGEWMTEETAAQMRAYGHVPEMPASSVEGAWDAEDMLVARLHGRDGELRALVYLDEPLDGLRPTARRLFALADELELTFLAIVGAVEREALAHRYQLGHLAREVLRATDGQHGVERLLEEARAQLRDGFGAVDLHIRVFGTEASRDEGTRVSAYATPALLAALEAAARRAHAAGTVAIVERDEVWGASGLETQHLECLVDLVVRHSLGSVVVVPVTAAGRLLGLLAIARAPDQERWVESESAAALDVGEDLGRAVLGARAFQKEQQLNEELRRLDDYRAELIATVAHEMKNPIGVVLGHLEMLEADAEAPVRVATSLGAMTRAAARLQGLAENLLTLSRLGRPVAPAERASVDLAGVVAQTLELVAVVAERARVSVEVAPVPAPVVVLGDADDLGHVVMNLLSNAVKYSDPGAVVHVGLEQHGEEVVLTVADEGLGISEADQERLFTEFFRSADARARARPGTGLGLAIVRRVVDRHDGRIEVDSVLGEGTTFRVVLPGG